MRGVVGDGRVRVALERAAVTSTVPGACAAPGELASTRWIECTLPGTAAAALRAAGAWSLDDRRAFDREDWWWRVPLADARRGDWLELAGIATLWDAWLDGAWVASGDSMWQPRAIELEAPANELVIRCRSLDAELSNKRPRPRWRVPMLEQQQLRWLRTTLLGRTPGWSPACPAIGPWRDVSLVRGGMHVGPVSVDARLEGGVGFVTVGAQLDRRVERATLVIRRGEVRIEQPLARAAASWTGVAAIEQPAVWWPHTHGEPAVYELAIEAMLGCEPVVIELGMSGFRTVTIDRGDGRFAVHVNGVRVFCRGACWTPLDPVTLRAPREAYAAAVAQARAAGMNMLRVAGTMLYEDDALYDACDAQGVLVWHDLMFANMDYPEDDAFVRAVELEADTFLSRVQARPSLAIVCGNSEVAQQAAMAGAERARWTPSLFHDRLAARAHAIVPDVPYVPSSTELVAPGAFPHEPRAGASSYYGVGAYLRPLDDARRAEVKFASECLAFANIPDGVLPKVHDPRWKAGSPRDLGAGWDFDDVRDHYVRELFGVDPAQLRTFDHDRYLALGRVATGEVMARTFAEWRRQRSVTGGGLVWFLRDLRPGAGWGLVDASGAAKPVWYLVRRALQPRALSITDEGANGLAVHLVNDRSESRSVHLRVDLWRAGDVRVTVSPDDRTVALSLEAGAAESPLATWFDAWTDLSFAYRFGPPIAEVVHVHGDELDAFWFPAGLALPREPDVGLACEVRDGALAITTKRFAQYVAIEGKGVIARDNYFHLAPGQTRIVHIARGARGTISALNSERTLRFEVPA
ncbi:MAG: glycoside hydrolase family 2 protein [Acidobacteriota bacterium]